MDTLFSAACPALDDPAEDPNTPGNHGRGSTQTLTSPPMRYLDADDYPVWHNDCAAPRGQVP